MRRRENKGKWWTGGAGEPLQAGAPGAPGEMGRAFVADFSLRLCSAVFTLGLIWRQLVEPLCVVVVVARRGAGGHIVYKKK